LMQGGRMCTQMHKVAQSLPLLACLLKSSVYSQIQSLHLNHCIKLQTLFWILSGHSYAIPPCLLDNFISVGWLEIHKFFCFFLPVARSLLSIFMQAIFLSYNSTELIYYSYCMIHLHMGCCRMLW
jgi:hypothetical protein